jgi:hypothetical protein
MPKSIAEGARIYSDIAVRPLDSPGMKIYRGFPQRLQHRVPHWVESRALFHIRIALDRQKEQKALTNPALAQAIFDSAKFYEAKMRWHITLFLLMPDHFAHAAIFPARSIDERTHQRLEMFSYANQSGRLAGRIF